MITEQLRMEAFPESHSHENIIARFQPILVGLKQDPKKAVFVTDSGANIKKAIKVMSVPMLCFAHKFNTSLEIGYSDCLEQCEALKAFDKSVTNLITYVNKSEINHNLPIRLKSGGVTRPWRHLYDKFYGVLRSYDSLDSVLSAVFIIRLLKLEISHSL